MSALVRFKAECEGCGRSIIDSSRTFVEQAADAHADECDDLEDDDDVVVSEVEP